MNLEIEEKLQTKIAVPKKSNFKKYFKQGTIILIGFLNLFDAVAEIIIGLSIDSLALFSDGIHNLSDVLTMIIALWVLNYFF
jgi:Co/Zn/Cd efflux system component